MQPAVTNVYVAFNLTQPKTKTTYQCPNEFPTIYAGEKMVVYGLADVPNDQREIQGTATLSGEILGKHFRHEVPFSSQLNPTEHTGTYPAHRLAAKALISDWQDAGNSKETITSLSVESSVISSYTAFIAVDEESSKPIEGPLQAWDIIGSGEKLAASANLFHSSARSRKKKSGFSGFNLPETRSAKLSSAKAKKKRATPLKPQRVLDFSSLEDCEGVAAPYAKLSASAQSCEGVVSPNFTTSAQSCSESLQADMLPSSVKANPLSSLIAAQQADGSWKLDSFLSTIISKSLKEIKDACPVKVENEAFGAVWATVLVLAILETKCKGQQEEWELIAMKADKWLKRQVLPEGADINVLHSSAQTLM